MKTDIVILSAEDSYIKSHGEFNSNYKFENVTILSITKSHYDQGTWKVSTNEDKAEIVTILGKYSNFTKMLEEITSSDLLIEKFDIDTENQSVSLSIRVKGVSRWTLPF